MYSTVDRPAFQIEFQDRSFAPKIKSTFTRKISQNNATVERQNPHCRQDGAAFHKYRFSTSFSVCVTITGVRERRAIFEETKRRWFYNATSTLTFFFRR